jgi:hypothetical protein
MPRRDRDLYALVCFADYSGSLVLQLPTDLACHVALQAQPVSNHRLWKHQLESFTKKASGPCIRVVSMAADQNNRHALPSYLSQPVVACAHMPQQSKADTRSV